MKGMNREAADAYLTAFNLRPGANTLYWIENGIFQTSVPYVVGLIYALEYLLLSFCMFPLV
ncbi:Transcriptional activator CadC [Shigella sonnei]|nr:Transcriptional activator CadC [Shigella sonnei]